MKLKNLYDPKCTTRLRAILCFCISLLCAATVISALPTKGEEAIYDRVIRLHVLANSDMAEDQALKLRVRDAVLTFLAEESAACTDAKEAQQVYAAMLPEIETVAQKTVQAAGYAYDCHVTLTEECYPRRTYDTVTLPGGTYRSLRVMIGTAAGQNWWCVLFPPLCLSLAADADAYTPVTVSNDDAVTAEEVLLAAGFTPYEVSLIAGGTEPDTTRIVVKFRLIEWLKTLFSQD